MAAADHYWLFETALGTCGLRWSERGVNRLRLPSHDGDMIERALVKNSPAQRSTAPPAAITRVIDDIVRYFAGEEIEFSAALLDLEAAGDFDRAIYAAARQIGFGHTMSYGEVARRAGFPKMTRETGQALGRNPIPLIVPCHRVVASDGRLGGFSAPGGRDTKERMLTIEGTRLPLLP